MYHRSSKARCTKSAIEIWTTTSSPLPFTPLPFPFLPSLPFFSLHFLTSTLLPFPSFTMRHKRRLLFSSCIMHLRTYLLTQHIENSLTHFPILDSPFFLHRKLASLIRFQATPPRSPRSPRSPPAQPASVHPFFSRMQTNSQTCLSSSSA